MIVADASVVVDFLIGSDSEASQEFSRLLRAGGGVAAPELLDVEVGQTVGRFNRIGDIDSAAALVVMSLLQELDIRRYPHRALVARAFDFRHRVTIYDGVYLALAEGLDAPLLTGDVALSRVPGTEAQVRLVSTSG